MAVVIWLLVALLAGIIEAVTVSLVSVWFALGAVASAIAAGFGLGTAAQVLVFLISSIILMILTAPLCRRFRIAEKMPTNADRLIGCTGIVTEDIDPIHNKGEVKVNGQTWSVQARGNKIVVAGSIVIVEEIVGAHLVVRVKNDNTTKNIESEE